MKIHPHPTRRTWNILSLTILLVLLVGRQVAAGHARPSPSPPSDSAMPPEPQSGIYRVYYGTQERLDILAAHFDIRQVEPGAGYAVLGLDGSSAAALIAQGYRLELDEEQTTQQLLGPPGYPCYRDVDELYADLQQLAADYPALTELIDYGDSWHKVTPGDEPGYDLWALKITNEQALTPAPKPRFFLMATIHARELTTPETAMYFVEHLLTNYDRDPDVTWVVDYHEIYVVVTANPDGLLIVEDGCLQRKNGNDARGVCRVCDPWGDDHYGVDLNRNNPYHWGGASAFPCAETYQGTEAASEPETYYLNDLVRAIFPDQRPGDDASPAPDDATGLLISLHSYSNLVLWPWGWTHDAAPNQAQLQTLGRKFAYFNNYMPEQSSALYRTTGDTTDWAYGELGIPAYTFELGEWFFQPCSDLPQIREENLETLLYAAKVARTPYLTASGPDVLNLSVSPGEVARAEITQVTATIDDTRYNNANGAESVQVVAAAEYYIDVPPWETGTAPIAQPLTALDGDWDAPVEGVGASIDTLGLGEGRHTIFLRGQDADGNWGAFSAVFLDVLAPTSSLALRPAIDARGGGRGHSVTYNLTLTNLGSRDERYLLGMSGNAWETTLSITTTAELPPLGATSVQVEVNVPLSASLGQTDTATVTATAQGDSTQSASSTLTTSAGLLKFYLPLVLRDTRDAHHSSQ